MSLGGGLTIAVPRGQLFEDTVALLARGEGSGLAATTAASVRGSAR